MYYQTLNVFMVLKLPCPLTSRPSPRYPLPQSTIIPSHQHYRFPWESSIHTLDLCSDLISLSTALNSGTQASSPSTQSPDGSLDCGSPCALIILITSEKHLAQRLTQSKCSHDVSCCGTTVPPQGVSAKGTRTQEPRRILLDTLSPAPGTVEWR